MDEQQVEQELPGMMELAIGVQKGIWPHTIDARAWTQKWLETIGTNTSIATDESFVIGWFANAIMAGHDAAQLAKEAHIDTESDIFNLHRVAMPIIRLMKNGNLSWAQMEECSWALQEAIRQHDSLMSEHNLLKNSAESKIGWCGDIGGNPFGPVDMP